MSPREPNVNFDETVITQTTRTQAIPHFTVSSRDEFLSNDFNGCTIIYGGVKVGNIQNNTFSWQDPQYGFKNMLNYIYSIYGLSDFETEENEPLINTITTLLDFAENNNINVVLTICLQNGQWRWYNNYHVFEDYHVFEEQ